jgi:hypothetical protein
MDLSILQIHSLRFCLYVSLKYEVIWSKGVVLILHRGVTFYMYD